MIKSEKTSKPRRALPAAGRHVVVTGGAGFIGSHLVERLLAAGKRVVVIDDLSTGRLANLRAVRRHPALRVIVAKISQCRELPALLRRTESVYHLAAAVGVDLVMRAPVRAIDTNLSETRVLLEAASPGRVPVLLASTSEVYGKSAKPVFSENDDLLIGPPTLRRWSYACSKLMDEFLALAYHQERGLPVVIARLFNTVGPRQTGRYGMVLPRFIAAAQAGRPLQVFGDGRQTRCFCFVGDTVEALLRLQNCPTATGQIFNVGANDEISIADLARRVRAITASKSAIKKIPYSQVYPEGFADFERRKPALAKLAACTGFRAETGLDEIIRRICQAAARGPKPRA